MNAYARLIRLDKPIGSLLLLWPTLTALWIAAQGHPSAWHVFVFTAGVFLMRAAGCAVNDYWDRDVDGSVERTRHRPLACGEISPKQALITAFILVLMAALLVVTLGPFLIALSVIGFLLALIYPLMKRITHLPQLTLGLAFSWGIPMAFAAEGHRLDSPVWLLVGISMLWSISYDTFYAMVDYEDDIKTGIKSTAVWWGDNAQPITCLLQASIIGLFIILGFLFQLTAWFYFGIALSAVFFIYQQHLINQRQTSAYFQAFLNNSWAWAAIFFGTVLALL